MYNSYIPALITPFNSNLDPDYKSFEKLLNYQLQNSIQTVLVNGTTAESPSLKESEKLELLNVAHSVIKNKDQIIFGAGSNCTRQTIEFVNKVEKTNLASTVLIVVPYYNKPTQEGIYKHFEAIAKNTSLNIMLYNVPSRTGVGLDVETVVKLAKIKNIVAIKDAVDDFSRLFHFKKEIEGNFYLTTGEDATACSYFASQGHGCISVTANLLPKHCVNVYNACKSGNYAEAVKLHTSLINIHKLMFCQASPAPVKYGLSLLGLCKNQLRLPLVSLSKENEEKVKQELKNLQVI